MTQKELERDFSRQNIKALKKAGIVIYGKTWLAGPNGDFANGQTGYKVDNSGMSQIKTYTEMLEIASLIRD